MPYKNLNLGNYNGAPRKVIPELAPPDLDGKPRLLFLVRKNPQSIGGIQEMNARISTGLSDSFQVERFIWSGPEWGAPIYFPLFYQKSLRNNSELIHCDDAVTSLIGAKIKLNTLKKVTATVHGLDVILPIPWYQEKLKRALAHIDKIICVSRATADQVKRRGIDPAKIEVIPCPAENAVEIRDKNDALYRAIENMTGIDLHGKKVLFSLGRLVRRKGFDQFAKDIFPNLPEDCVYIVAGPKPKSPSWIKAMGPMIGKRTKRLLYLASGCDSIHDELLKLSEHPRIYYLNNISRELRDLLFAASDLFIMPNRPVDGDMEGFGIVALEASIRGVPVIAYGIEGITDAVIDNENGFCVAQGNTEEMINLITALLEDSSGLASIGIRARQFTLREFSIERVAGQYARIFNELLEDGIRNRSAGSSSRL